MYACMRTLYIACKCRLICGVFLVVFVCGGVYLPMCSILIITGNYNYLCGVPCAYSGRQHHTKTEKANQVS